MFPLSQEEQQQEEPHQNIPEGNILEVLNFVKSLNKPNQTHATPIFLHQPYFPPHLPTLTLFSQRFFQTQKVFWTQNFYDPIFYGPKFFEPQILPGAKICFRSRNCWTKIILKCKFFLDWNHVLTKLEFDTENQVLFINFICSSCSSSILSSSNSSSSSIHLVFLQVLCIVGE